MVYALDSNILLLDAHNLHTVGDDSTVIVIPETVLDELDSKKSVQGEIGYQAREFGRIVTAGECVGVREFGNIGITVVEYKIQNKLVHIVSLREYPSYTGMERNVINDRKIIDAVIVYSYKARMCVMSELVFITNDIACGIRAQSLGLQTEQLRDTTDKDISYNKELALDDEDFRTIHGKNITNYDSSYVQGNYNYYITNEYTGQTKLATIKRGVVNVLGKESEQELRKQEVCPQNSGQLFLSRAIQDQTISLVVVEALSGSGKTLLSLSNAIKLVKTNSPYKSIVYIRGSVNDVPPEEEVGFLKGSADEKNSVYFHPILDSLDFIAKKRIGSTKLKGRALDEAIEKQVEKIVEDCDIHMMTGLGMRGRTFEDAVVIIDEAQNFSKASLRKILTRFGKNCKIAVVGSNKQIDNPYVTKYTNGLSVLLDAATEEQQIDMHVVQLDKVVRSEFAEFAENLFEGK